MEISTTLFRTSPNEMCRYKWIRKKMRLIAKVQCTAVARAIMDLDIGTCLLYLLNNALVLRNAFKCTSCSVAWSEYFCLNACCSASEALVRTHGFLVAHRSLCAKYRNQPGRLKQKKKLYILYCKKCNYTCLCRSWNHRENVNGLCTVLFTAILAWFAVTASHLLY